VVLVRAISEYRRPLRRYRPDPAIPSLTNCERTRLRRSIAIAAPGARHSMISTRGDCYEGADGYNIPRPTR
jgi:hypothetical protein